MVVVGSQENGGGKKSEKASSERNQPPKLAGRKRGECQEKKRFFAPLPLPPRPFLTQICQPKKEDEEREKRKVNGEPFFIFRDVAVVGPLVPLPLSSFLLSLSPSSRGICPLTAYFLPSSSAQRVRQQKIH